MMGMNPACRGCKYEYPLFNNTCALCGDHNLYEPREPKEQEKENKPMKKTKAMLEEELDQKRAEIEELKKELEKVEKYKQYDDAAGEMKAIYDSLVNVGFSEDQAFTLLNTMLNNQKSAEPVYRSSRYPAAFRK